MVVIALVVAALAVAAAIASVGYSIYARRQMDTQMDTLRQEVAEALDAEEIMRRAQKPGRRRSLYVVPDGAVAWAKDHKKEASAAVVGIAGIAAALMALTWPNPSDVPVARRETDREMATDQPARPADDPDRTSSSTTSTTGTIDQTIDPSGAQPVVALDNDGGNRATLSDGDGGRGRQVPPLSPGAMPAEPHSSAGSPSPSSPATPPVGDEPPETAPPSPAPTPSPPSRPPTTAPPRPPAPPPTTAPPPAEPERTCHLARVDALQLLEVCL